MSRALGVACERLSVVAKCVWPSPVPLECVYEMRTGSSQPGHRTDVHGLLSTVRLRSL
jgi:hypothetical protein